VSIEFDKIIDHTIYPRKALADARQAYRDYCTLKVVPAGNDKVQISIRVNDAHERESRQVVLDFLNYVLDRSAQLLFEEDSE
jgi:hypothetical protein